MFKKHEKLFSVILTALFCIGIAGYLIVHLSPSHRPGTSLSAISIHHSADSAIIGGKVNINTADAQALQLLPDIGPTLASRIIEYRNKNGSYHTTEELLQVKGIGQITYQKISVLITVGGTL